MAMSVRCCLKKVLEDLTEGELETFKANLNEFPVKEDFSNIPRGQLEKADALKLSILLVHHYCDDYAVEVAAKVLSDINCKPQAQRLLRNTGKAGFKESFSGGPPKTRERSRAFTQRESKSVVLNLGSMDACNSAQEPVPQISTHSSQAVQAPGMHFVERHREALIQRTTVVEEILDPLYGIALTDEQYQNIMIKGTSQDKMRALFSFLPGWNEHCKDLLKEILKDKRKALYEDLERQ